MLKCIKKIIIIIVVIKIAFINIHTKFKYCMVVDFKTYR